jgi:hypothetical protein
MDGSTNDGGWKFRAVICTAAERPPFIIPNIYYGNQLIGVGIRLRGHKYLSILWRRPKAPATYPEGS